MKILFEDTMPHAATYFAELGNATPYRWQDIQPKDLIDVDVLAVRSTTKVNPHLLAQANRLQYVTTATAGINHFDIESLEDKGIAWGSAAGCNAVAVAQYVFSVLLNAEKDKFVDLDVIRVGIVGAGNVGTQLTKLLDVFDIDYVLYDPILASHGDPREFGTLDDVFECDVVTLHVPYTQGGNYPTAKMVNEARLAQLNAHQLLINACRGEVVDEQALLARLAQSDCPRVVLDVFENEPDIDMTLVDKVWLATPHIAGHTIEGKIRGTQMVYDQICALKNSPATCQMTQFLPPVSPLNFDAFAKDYKGLRPSDVYQLLLSIYDIQDDDRHFRKCMAQSSQFAALRKQYRVRREYSAFTVHVPESLDDISVSQLMSLGFKVVVVD